MELGSWDPEVGVPDASKYTDCGAPMVDVVPGGGTVKLKQGDGHEELHEDVEFRSRATFVAKFTISS